jgi:putative membrane protein
MPPSDWWPFMWWFPMFPIVFMALCVIIVLFVMVPMMRGHGPGSHWRDRPDYPQKTALDILNERYANGEIDKTEYEEKRRVLSMSSL